MTDSTRLCRGCGNGLQALKRQGNPRKWCSEACRVRFYRENTPGHKARRAEKERARAARVEAAKPPKPRCAHCGDELALRRADWKFCSKPKCKRASNVDLVASSPRCKEPKCFRPGVAHGLCGTHYSRAYRKANPEAWALIAVRANRKRRAVEAAAFVEHVELPVLLERAGWVCGICGEDIPKSATFPDVLSPSLDHVIPLSRGGKHEYANAQAAHYGCNSAKQDKVDFVMS